MKKSIVECMVFSARKKKRLTEVGEVWQIRGSWKTSLKRFEKSEPCRYLVEKPQTEVTARIKAWNQKYA